MYLQKFMYTEKIKYFCILRVLLIFFRVNLANIKYIKILLCLYFIIIKKNTMRMF